MSKITVGSLFSGIGGLELGLERTGGFRTIWFSEIDDYASAVLKKHWPGVPNLGDITKVNWNEIERPGMLTGGFPCQDISVAGKGKGIREGKRSGLWREYAEAIRILRPRYALIENVPELAIRGLDVVLADLAEIGYDAEWFTLSAADVGAWHRRQRIFIIAPPVRGGCDDGSDNRERGRLLPPEIRAPTQEEQKRDGRLARIGEDGDDVPHTEDIGCERSRTSRLGRDGLEDDGAAIPDALRGAIQGGRASRKQEPITSAIERLSGCRRAANKRGIWATEPGMGRVADGVPNRVDRIKCLGNAVVPACAEVIGEYILETEVLL